MDVAHLKDVDLAPAYVVTGDSIKNTESVVEALGLRGVAVHGNPDVMILKKTDLLIETVRDEILPFASLKPLGVAKYCLVTFSRANDASQNALLKAIEDSFGRTHFFFFVEAVGHVLPTIRSRAVVLQGLPTMSKRSDERDEALEFLREGYEARLQRVEKMVGYISKTQEHAPVRAFVNALLQVGHENNLPAGHMRDILASVSYMRMQGSSPKAVLGHLAVTLERTEK